MLLRTSKKNKNKSCLSAQVCAFRAHTPIFERSESLQWFVRSVWVGLVELMWLKRWMKAELPSSECSFTSQNGSKTRKPDTFLNTLKPKNLQTLCTTNLGSGKWPRVLFLHPHARTSAAAAATFKVSQASHWFCRRSFKNAFFECQRNECCFRKGKTGCQTNGIWIRKRPRKESRWTTCSRSNQKNIGRNGVGLGSAVVDVADAVAVVDVAVAIALAVATDTVVDTTTSSDYWTTHAHDGYNQAQLFEFAKRAFPKALEQISVAAAVEPRLSVSVSPPKLERRLFHNDCCDDDGVASVVYKMNKSNSA